MRKLLIVAALFLASLPSLGYTTPTVGDVIVSQPSNVPSFRFTVLTANGYVSFSVSKDWRVITMQSKPPVAVAGFQLVNQADKHTSDATNVVISLIQPGTEEGERALIKIGKSYEGSVTASSRLGWDLYSQKAHQKETEYAVLDAKKSIADVIVAVRVAWPHLSKNSPQYDSGMQEIFDNLLKSIDGNLGVYTTQPGDVLRRPEK
ncbi:hypothetical protein [Acidicapsa acidisoli]|uniref:hypothetical protein n=1 Tax=Acidicapsa acidisoli TaxID=1615681 RepID=UPI0021E08FBA|nr:hypothetical protein [Acidicapsa acidisoli]